MPAFSRTAEPRIIGVDCATQPKSVGLSLCTFAGERARLEEVAVERTWAAIDAKVRRWLGPTTLIAIDAPLGWPLLLANALGLHRAGAGLSDAANRLFRRRTDDVVAQSLGKRPLDVGADRIARTAHAALGLLARLRETEELPIPLAWEPGAVRGVAAIEVYPAGTLASRGLPRSGYKGARPAAVSVRQTIVDAVSDEITIEETARHAMMESDHVLDAVLCAIAGQDFLRADVMALKDLELAQREGWIWVRARPDCGRNSTL